MPVYTVWMLEKTNITVSDGNSLDGGPRGNGARLVGKTLTLDNGNYLETQIQDDENQFFANDNRQQSLSGQQTINGTTFADGTRVSADYQLTLMDSTGKTYTVYAYNVKPANGTDTNVEGLVLAPNADGSYPPVGEPLTITASAQGPTGRDQNPYSLYDTPPCFTPGTLIATPYGPRKVEELQPGDLVLTRDNGAQPLRWVARAQVTAADLLARPALAPVRIAAGALGGGLPRRPLVLSPQHRVLMSGWQAELFFAAPEVLVPAVALLGDKATRTETGEDGVDYLHLLFDRHEIILAEGAEVESLLPDWLTNAGISPALREELALLLHTGPDGGDWDAVLPCLTVGEGRVFA